VLTGRNSLPRLDQDFELALAVEHLAVDAGFFAQLPEGFKKIDELYKPAGPLSFTLTLTHRRGVWQQRRVELQPEDMTACYKLFPYTLERVRGKLDLDLLNEVFKIDLVGHSGSQPVTIRGLWKGAGDNSDAQLDIQADN